MNAAEPTHAGDCTIYALLQSGTPIDGICTCGYGWSLVRLGDWSKMYSQEFQKTYLDKSDP